MITVFETETWISVAPKLQRRSTKTTACVRRENCWCTEYARVRLSVWLSQVECSAKDGCI